MSSSVLGHRHPPLLPSATTNNLRKRSGMKSKQQQPLLPSSVPSYDVPADVKDDHSEGRRSRAVRRLSWGIFQVAYEAPVRHLSLSRLRESLRDLRDSAPSAGRLLVEIYSTARTPVTVHLLAGMVLMVAPAFSLYLSASVLAIVEETVISRQMTDLHVSMLQVLVFMWLFLAVMSTLANRIMAETAFTLKGHLRAHFLPQLVNASLRLDLAALQSRKAMRSLPAEYAFEIEVPGYKFFHEIVTRLRNFLTVVAEVGVLLMVISRRGLHEAQLLAFFSLMLPAVMLLKPNTGVGGAGYVFWTPNVNFYYLAALYKIAFSHHFRSTLARDGMCSYIAEEYRRISGALGYLNVETVSIAMTIQVRWYWDLISLIVDYPLAICALILPWADPLSSLVTMVLVQHATTTLQQSIYQLRGNPEPDTLVDVLGWAKDLYEAVALDSELYRGKAQYPDKKRSDRAGMKVSFRNVSFKYQADGPLALSDVNFEIAPGSLALIVGVNGSGKTSLLSLIQRLQEPSGGEIRIDDKPIAKYDVDSLRGAMACLSQDEDMYPLSLRQNMLMGAEGDESTKTLEAAAKMGCASQLIDRLPRKFDTVLDPAAVIAQSAQGCGHGHISAAVMSELEEHGHNVMQTSVSGGEKQRLAATRLFARLLNLKDRVKLIVCDEATGAMDPCAEKEILHQLKGLRHEKTVILVTHRFGGLVKEADVILVMKEGRLVQRGTHTELMRDGGEYAEMYRAQIGLL
ncbi:P-loop containing nucleoside triphosphate hydrolase protein [Mycena galericulata]|nr:P-loop containing nucleoside triphosphate hydrolase protein [Mycena galericulata]